MKESDIQKESIKLFRIKYPDLCWTFVDEKGKNQKCQWLIASLNGVNLSGKKAFMIINSMKSQGMVDGEADLHLPIKSKNLNWNSLYIELKTDIGKQRLSQKAFQVQAYRIGCNYLICRSADEVMAVIKDHLGY